MKVENEYRIWDNGAPGSNPSNWPFPGYKEEWRREGDVDLLAGVTDPTIKLFLPDASKNTGAAVLICPGGGYNVLSMDKEGYEVARRLRELGVAGIVLKYRHYNQFAARDDAQRAIRFIRCKSKEWGIRPDAIGIGGFSAGGHLALHCAANPAPKADWMPDAIDRIDDRPNFLMLVYPSTHLPEGVIVGKNIPPAFINAAADDPYKISEEAVVLFNRLRELEIPAELHIHQDGGHAYGVGAPGSGCSSWIGLFAIWLRTNGFISVNIGNEGAR